MRRREFITLIGGAAAWPLAARAQQPAKLPTIGFFNVGLSFIPRPMGQHIRCSGCANSVGPRAAKLRSNNTGGEGRNDRLAEIAAEFVRLKVNVIVTGGNALPAATKATSTIPIVFALAADPFASGAIASLARPGRNITGLSMQQPDLIGKRLELLREIVPGLRRLAVVLNGGTPASAQEMGVVQTTAGKLGFEVIALDIRQAADIVPAFEAIKGRADALYVVGGRVHERSPDPDYHLGPC